MKFSKFAALCVSISVPVLWGVFSFAQSTTKAIIVRPESAEAGQQELELKGLKTSSEAVGVRVFLDPTTDCKLDVNSKSYLGNAIPLTRKIRTAERSMGILFCPSKGK